MIDVQDYIDNCLSFCLQQLSYDENALIEHIRSARDEEGYTLFKHNTFLTPLKPLSVTYHDENNTITICFSEVFVCTIEEKDAIPLIATLIENLSQRENTQMVIAKIKKYNENRNI